MDIPKVAADLTKILAPFLPYLIAGTKAAAEEAGKRFGKAAWEKMVELWGKLKPKVDQKESTREALHDAVQEPDDEGAQKAWEYKLKKILTEDPAFAAQIEITIRQINNVFNEVNVGGNVTGSMIMIGTGNQLDIHGNVYVGAQPQNDEDALEIYRGYVATITSSVSTSGLNLKADAVSGSKEQMRLAKIYIELDTKTQIDAQGEMRERTKSDEDEFDVTALRQGEEKTKPLSVLQAAQNQMLVVKGDPGSGKSTFVNFLSFCLASQNTELLDEYWRGQDLLPIIIILRDFAKTIPENPEQAEAKHLCGFIEQTLKNKNLSFASAPIFQLLEQGKVLVFLDGLDEVQSVEKRIFVRDAVKEFITRYGKNHFAATCRVLSYQEPKEKDEPDLRLAGFPEFEVAPFTPEKINLFIDRWYWELMNLNVISKSEADEKIKNLKTAAQTRQELKELAPNPLLLTVMAIVNTHRGKLPDSRVYLYQDAIDILLWQWERKNKNQETHLLQLLTEANKKESDLQKMIWKLAYEAHAQTTKEDVKNNALAGISELALQNALAKINKGNKKWAIDVIEAMRLRAGLLLERDTGVFTFPHRSFQEFLAGAYIESGDDGDFVAIADKLANNLMVWREAILWAVGLCVKRNITNPIMLAASLCPSTLPKDQNDWLRIWFAGDVLLEVGIDRVEENDLGKNTVLPLVRNRLVQLLEQNALTPRERAEAGDTLAKLGDPRFDTEHWHLPNEALLGFVHIPAGEFLMGTKKSDIKGLVEKFGGKEEYYTPEVPQRKLHLPDYFMARYPVTVAQFKTFVEERSEHKPDREESLLGVPTHPVAYVTWFDAIAYCKWLTEKLKESAKAAQRDGKNEIQNKFWQGLSEGSLIVTLPSEAEWEKAARGADGRAFPWQGDFDQEKVNSNMVIGRVSAVGAFPLGKSPNKLQDMAGNVWEWTRSIYEKYPYEISEKRENLEDKKSARVLRGGSCGNVERRVRCAYRGGGYPFDWYYDFGFRVVVCVSSPISL